MPEITISADEYKSLIRSREHYNMLMNAIRYASEVYIREYETFMRLDEEAILNAFKVIDRDGYDALFQIKLIEAQEKAESEVDEDE